MRLTKEQAASSKYRTRNWQSILYPDSAHPDWKEKLAEAGVQAFVSPLHDKDISGDGSQKKPHYHIVVMYQNKKAFWQVDELFKDLGALNGFQSDGKSAFMTCDDLRISVRYLLHLDNPEKARYSEDDILSFGGADFGAIATLPGDDDEIVDEITRWLDDYHIFSYRVLLIYARDNNRRWFRFLNHKGSRHIYQYIKSAQWEYKENGYLLFEPEKLRKVSDTDKEFSKSDHVQIRDESAHGLNSQKSDKGGECDG